MNKSFLILLLFISNFSFSQKDLNGKFENEVVIKNKINYALHVPKNTNEKKPLIVFISGDGEKGTDIEKVKIHGPLK